MADIKLGPSGSQVTLPAPTWPDGSPAELPYDIDEPYEEEIMADGSNRIGFSEYTPGSWSLSWDGISATDLATVLGAATLGAILVYTNGYTDAANHNVVVKSYSYALKAETGADSTKYYTLTLELREVLGE